MTTRRELIKSLPAVAAIPLILEGKEIGKAVPVESNKQYLIFVSERSGIDLDLIAEGCGKMGMRGCLYVCDDPESAVRLYEVKP